jgi:hypothetical protein
LYLKRKRNFVRKGEYMVLQSICSIIVYIVVAFPAVLIISFFFHDLDKSRHQLRDIAYIFLISILPAIVAWLIIGNLKDTERLYRAFKWVLLIASIGAGSFILFLSLIMDKSHKLKKKFLTIGIILTLIFIFFGVIWFNFNLTWILKAKWLLVLGWILFGILILASLVLIIWGGYQIYDFEELQGLLKIVIGLITTSSATTITYYWLNNLVILNFCKWSIFIVIGALSIVYFFGSILFLSFEGMNKNRIVSLIGGICGIGLALTFGYFILHLKWVIALFSISTWLPIVMFTPFTILIALLLNKLLRLWSQGMYRNGSLIDKSGEWRIAGSNRRYKDATVQDMYDHRHGRGSWEKSVRGTIMFWRVVTILISAFALPVILLYSDKNNISGIFIRTVNAFNDYAISSRIILFVILLSLSIILNSRSK